MTVRVDTIDMVRMVALAAGPDPLTNTPSPSEALVVSVALLVLPALSSASAEGVVVTSATRPIPADPLPSEGVQTERSLDVVSDPSMSDVPSSVTTVGTSSTKVVDAPVRVTRTVFVASDGVTQPTSPVPKLASRVCRFASPPFTVAAKQVGSVSVQCLYDY